MKKINCALKCKKTEQLRCSSKCMKIAFVKSSGIVYSCDKSIKTEAESNFYNCEFIDNGITSECESCPLVCINKKSYNPEDQKAKDILEGMGINISSVGDFGKTMAQYASSIVSDTMSGKKVDIDRLKTIYKIIKEER